MFETVCAWAKTYFGFCCETTKQNENVFARKVACANKIEFLFEKLNTYSTLHIKYAQTVVRKRTSDKRSWKIKWTCEKFGNKHTALFPAGIVSAPSELQGSGGGPYFMGNIRKKKDGNGSRVGFWEKTRERKTENFHQMGEPSHPTLERNVSDET